MDYNTSSLLGRPRPGAYAEQPAANGAPAAAADKKSFLAQRLVSLDVYRGLIMITLAFNGFGLAATARNHLRTDPDSTAWATVFHHFEHVEWTGCGYWDLIQPSFMFMVGVAMPFSYGRRGSQGASHTRMLLHAVWRSLVLVFLGIFLISNGRSSTDWSLMNVLTQIGLGYTFLFLLWGRSLPTQWICVGVILVGTWLLYVLWPGSGVDLQSGVNGEGVQVVKADWAQKHLKDIAPAWHKDANAGHFIDRVILNWLPQKEPFRFNRGGYQTINFLPSLATMLFGLMCGELLRSNRSGGKKVAILFLGGIIGLAAGYLLAWTGVCPLIKRIWTPSWALFSTGWCCLILGSLFAIVDVAGLRFWTFPLVVVGVNSIAIYCMSQLLKPWTAGTWQIHFGEDVFKNVTKWLGETAARIGVVFDAGFQPMVQSTMVGVVFWLICVWMYRQRIFVRI
jgi:heparan-alpha-glucosaminide N-acetyltransferase